MIGDFAGFAMALRSSKFIQIRLIPVACLLLIGGGESGCSIADPGRDIATCEMAGYGRYSDMQMGVFAPLGTPAASYVMTCMRSKGYQFTMTPEACRSLDSDPRMNEVCYNSPGLFGLTP